LSGGVSGVFWGGAIETPSKRVSSGFVHHLTMLTRVFRSTFVDSRLFKLAATMTCQSVVKHVLTEGDKFILSWFSPLQDQGGYALAVNYGVLDSECGATRADLSRLSHRAYIVPAY
jgi:hypothetical protein